MEKRKEKESCPRTTHNISKHQQIVDNAAKRRMINGLSQMRGLTHGLTGIRPESLNRTLTAEEARMWAEIAQAIARQLHGFARMLARMSAPPN